MIIKCFYNMFSCFFGNILKLSYFKIECNGLRSVYVMSTPLLHVIASKCSECSSLPNNLIECNVSPTL